MNNPSASTKLNQCLRRLPNVNEAIAFLAQAPGLEELPLGHLKHHARSLLDQLRQELLTAHQSGAALPSKEAILKQLLHRTQTAQAPSLMPLINGAGVIIHTNLGRAPLPECIGSHLQAIAQSYSNLELDLETGKRGRRYSHVDTLLRALSGAEAALVVNNNAAAVLIALETLAKGKEVIVSRGQLVEIGGSFRIPEIMARSGAKLVEVGATNRTHLRDYEQAITSETGLLLRVHCSNYRMLGFTSEVALKDLAVLGRARGIPVMDDLGSGCLINLARLGLEPEPTVEEAVAAGADLVAFSGDKLLGGPQAGILVGKKAYIDQIQANPLNRALRIDKLTLAALERLLHLYLDKDQAIRSIPTLRMLATPAAAIKAQAEAFCAAHGQALGQGYRIELAPVQSRVGGGALPLQEIPSWAIALEPISQTSQTLERALRHTRPPVIGRMEHGRLLLDMRTIAEHELDRLADSLLQAMQG